MVLKLEIKTKDGESYTTQSGEKLYDYSLEAGDVFIPEFNNVSAKKRERIVKGKKKLLKEFKIKAVIRDKDGVEYNEWLKLTETQANKLIKEKEENKVEINQHMWSAYLYPNDHGDQVGVAMKSSGKPPKKFEDFE